MAQEWDWPPQGQFRAHATVSVGASEPVRKSGWNSPFAKRAADLVFGGAVFAIKLLAGAVLGAVIVACAALLWMLL